MQKNKAIQVKFSLYFIAATALSLFFYVQWVAINFHITHAEKQSAYLSNFTDRAIGRLQTNPQWFRQKRDGKSLGSQRLHLALYYAELVENFPSIRPLNEITNNTIFVHLVNFRGIFKTPNYIIVKPVFMPNGDKYFGYVHVAEELNDKDLSRALTEEIQPALFIALAGIVGMFLFQLRQISSINSTAMDMANWADSIDAKSGAITPPNFHQPRLNHIAFTINKSLLTFSNVLEKEQSFAKYTSHELRTPIAAMSANIEVLEMMMKDLSPKERQVLKRLESAVSDMKYQIDALLWMSKENEIGDTLTQCNVYDMTKKSTQDNAYLTIKKNIETNTTEFNLTIYTHPVLFQIILNNLIRNAYQNTIDGRVDIVINSLGLTITNKSDEQLTSKEEGFGIGLFLVEKLVKKLQIEMTTLELENGRRVSLSFTEQIDCKA